MARKLARPIPKRQLRRTFLREWRKNTNNMTLVAVGEVVGLSHAQLGRIERGEQPYNQELLEALADLYGTDPASLLMRDPGNLRALWSIWDQAKEAERQEIEKYADFIVKSRSGT